MSRLGESVCRFLDDRDHSRDDRRQDDGIQRLGISNLTDAAGICGSTFIVVRAVVGGRSCFVSMRYFMTSGMGRSRAGLGHHVGLTCETREKAAYHDESDNTGLCTFPHRRSNQKLARGGPGYQSYSIKILFGRTRTRLPSSKHR